MDEIRARIKEMPTRIKEIIKRGGFPYKSKLWQHIAESINIVVVWMPCSLIALTDKISCTPCGVAFI
jgi:hypothetical protein